MKTPDQNVINYRIFDTVPSPYIIFSPELVILNASNILLAAINRKREEIVGKYILEAFPSDSGDRNREGSRHAFESLQYVLKEKKPHYMPVQRYDVTGRDGTLVVKYWQPSNHPVLDNEGNILYIIQHAPDITRQVEDQEKLKMLSENTGELIAEEKIRKKELREREVLVHQLSMQAPSAMGFLKGNNYVVDFANDSLCRLWDRTRDEILGKPLFDILPEIRNQGFEELLQNVFKTGVPYLGKEVPGTLRRNGKLETVYFDFTYNPVFDEHGRTNGITLVAKEVTDSVRDSQKLRESEERFRTMAEDSMILIATSDETGNSTYFSKAWVELTGRPLEDFLKYGWLDMVHPEDRDYCLNILHQSYQKQECFTGEFRIRAKDGGYRWLYIQAPPRFHADGTLAGYISSCIDITERKEAEKNLELKNEQLQRINNDLDNFIYTASHDLKAPISNIEGLMHVLPDTHPAITESEEFREIMCLIHTSIAQFKNTIVDLTEISRIQRVTEGEMAEVRIREAIGDVKISLREEILRHQAELTEEIPEGIAVTFSKKNFRSILYNLLSNAIKYRSPGRNPKITLQASDRDDFTVLTVTDNGLGIEESKLPLIFDMFKRVHTHVEGSGIGLYIVKRTLENYGGRVEVESTPGQGSTFRLFFLKNKRNVV